MGFDDQTLALIEDLGVKPEYRGDIDGERAVNIDRDCWNLSGSS
jgi:hypothetical protein